MDEQEWRISCFGMETGKAMVKESWINGKYAFLFAKGILIIRCIITDNTYFMKLVFAL